jgi:probable HAF family extracellular repeat protein
MIDLPSLGGTFTEAKAINDAGDVTGASFLPGGSDFDAVLWRKGQVIDLGVVPGDLCAEGMAINSRGQVVGYSNHDECHTAHHAHGFLWEHGRLFDLNQLVSNRTNLVVYEAVRINDRGEIAGNAWTPGGDRRAIVLIPCDENHIGMKGCNYSAVEDRAALTSSPISQPASQTMINPGSANRQLQPTRTHQH